MDFLYILFTSVFSVLELFAITKFLGYREMSQLSMFDYINGITIGSIAAELATSIDGEFWQPMVAMLVYGLFIYISAFLTSKSMWIRRHMTGTPLILYNNGQLYYKNVKKAKLDLQEVLVQCRIAGYFDISKLQSIIIESNGKMSFIPLETERPATPGDLNIFPTQSNIVATVIVDGKILYGNLSHTGNNEEWLRKQLALKNISDISTVFFATCDDQNTFNAYIKAESPTNLDILE